MSNAIGEASFDAIEALLKSGDLNGASLSLAMISPTEVPRKARLRAANLCRRAGLVTQGLKILWPVAHPDLRAWATGAELAEFAVLLLRTGAVDEALSLLGRLDASTVHEVWLYRAYCHFNQWNYESATEDLQNYVSLESNPYPRLVGKVNLAAAYVTLENHARATDLLNELIHETKRMEAFRLQANCHEQRAQLHILSGQWREAREELELARLRLKSTKQLDAFFIRKWRAIIDAREFGGLDDLHALRAEAEAAGDFESARDLDYFSLQASFDPTLFEKLYAGTPYAFYRKRLERLAPDYERSGAGYLFGDSGGSCLDLRSGELDGQSALNTGKQTHQLLLALTRDLYRPLSVGALHAELFKGDFFNVDSSPNRVHQSLTRARRWLVQAELPLAIKEVNRCYRLEVPVGYCVRLLPLEERSSSAPAKYESKLRLLKAREQFSWREAKDTLAMADSSFKRLMRWALENGRIERVGEKSSGQYRFLKSA